MHRQLATPARALLRGAATPDQLGSALHRIPVLWSLYRPLLRLAPSRELASHISRSFRRSLNLRNLARIKAKLYEAYTMLDELERANSGNTFLQAKYSAISSHLALIRPAPLPAPKPPPRKPVLMPGIIFSTAYNPPLPRLKPQPEHISMLIFNRRKAVQRRWDRFAVAQERLQEAREETRFEQRLGVDEGRWGEDWAGTIQDLKGSFDRESARNAMPVGRKLLDRAVMANKKREVRRKNRVQGVA